MLSFWRWTIGTGHEHLTDKDKIAVEESRASAAPASATTAGGARPHSAARAANMHAASPAKRKRGDSSRASASAHPRPPLQHATPSLAAVPPRAPQFLSHVEVAVQNAKNAVARPFPSAAAAAIPGNQRSAVKNGYVSSVRPPQVAETMEWEATVATNVPRRTSSHAKTKRSAAPARALSTSTPAAAVSTEAAKSDNAKSETERLSELQQRIEAEFSLEILLKHNELRLIDQEIAKCQVALEQLRRCSVIPYPSQTGAPADMLAVSDGMGSSLPSEAQPESAAPWGVMDGPYSRHYARWLIPDPFFDGLLAAHEPTLASVASHTGLANPKHRTTGSISTTSRTADKGLPSLGKGSSRPHRGSGALRLQALPAGYPEPKEAKGPMVLRRAADGKLVKLVCVDCHREDFSSPQGFINHCRIAHGRNLPSHEAAAQVCGVEVDPNGADGVGGGAAGNGSNGEAGVAGSSIAAATPTTAGALATPGTAGAASLVHPYIRGNIVPTRIPTLSHPPPPRSARTAAATPTTMSNPSNPNRPSVTMNGTATTATFVPSAQAPHLSSLVAKAGGGIDLGSLIAEATKHEPLVSEPEDDDEDEDGDADYGDDAAARDDTAMDTDDSPAPPSAAGGLTASMRPPPPARQPSRGIRGGPTRAPSAPAAAAPSAGGPGRKGPERAARRPPGGRAAGGLRVASVGRPADSSAPASSSATATQPALDSTPPEPEGGRPASSLQTAPSSHLAPSLVSDREGDEDDDADAYESGDGGASSAESSAAADGAEVAEVEVDDSDADEAEDRDDEEAGDDADDDDDDDDEDEDEDGDVEMRSAPESDASVEVVEAGEPSEEPEAVAPASKGRAPGRGAATGRVLRGAAPESGKTRGAEARRGRAAAVGRGRGAAGTRGRRRAGK